MALLIKPDGRILCAAKHVREETDTYVDDDLHYRLAVLDRFFRPTREEPENGLWYSICITTLRKSRHSTKNLRHLLYLIGKGNCGICKTPIGNINHSNIDHIRANSKKGTGQLANLQISHIKCNRDKADK